MINLSEPFFTVNITVNVTKANLISNNTNTSIVKENKPITSTKEIDYRSLFDLEPLYSFDMGYRKILLYLFDYLVNHHGMVGKYHKSSTNIIGLATLKTILQPFYKTDSQFVLLTKRLRRNGFISIYTDKNGVTSYRITFTALKITSSNKNMPNKVNMTIKQKLNTLILGD